MSEPFLGEIRIVAYNFAHRGWALCNGQLLPINQNQALFSILGTTYGGDGRTNFALPNFQGRVPAHAGNGFVLGEIAGEAAHTLIQSEMPAHTHTPVGTTNNANQSSPSNAFWAVTSGGSYSQTANSDLSPYAIGPVGGSQPHNNMSPYLVLTFCIALQGIYPSRN